MVQGSYARQCIRCDGSAVSHTMEQLTCGMPEEDVAAVIEPSQGLARVRSCWWEALDRRPMLDEASP